MTDGQTAFSSHPRHRYSSLEIGINRVSGKPQLPGSETAAAGRSRNYHPAISLRKMCVESHCDVIDEARANLIWPLDRSKQTWGKIGYDGILNCDA